MSIIYGPVPSWRLGRSLGIDMVSTPEKTCSFDCVYCQLGRTVHLVSERKEYVSIPNLASEIERLGEVSADYATFSGVAEPTIAANLGRAIKIVKSTLKLPVAVLTNSSLMPRGDVREDLSQADVVVVKIDAPNQQIFRKTNRPVSGFYLNNILQGIARFRSEFSGKLAIQMMFIEANKGCAVEMARIAERISPDEIQINTPLRPCAVKPLFPEEIDVIKQAFDRIRNVVTVYEAPKPEVAPLNREETRRRRPAEGR
jgi:wyosine [tRNA(Phe)-imidazoG37] synthetase (radical SAM superfamily)